MDSLSKTNQLVLKDSIVRSLIEQGVPDNIAKSSAERVSENASADILNGINSSLSNKFNNIPLDTIGNLNNLDAQNGNLTSADLTQITSNEINNTIVPDVSASLAQNLINDLRTNVSPNILDNINLSSLQTNLTNSLGSGAVSNLANSNLSDITNSLFSNAPPITPLVGLSALDSLPTNAQGALNSLRSLFGGGFSAAKINAADLFDVVNDKNRDALAGTNLGFLDPNANYPQEEPIEFLTELPSLAQGVPQGSIHQIKNKERMTGAKLPGDSTWDQPASPFNGKYPFNQVRTTESNHVMEIDDTPDAERLLEYHRTGTFREIDANGSIVTRVKGSNYEIIDKNGKISICGRADISIKGDCNVWVGNDANLEVEGDVNIVCRNDINAFASGKVNFSSKESFNITTESDINFQAEGSINLKAVKNINSQSQASINQKSSADHKIEAGSVVSVKGGSLFAADAGQVHLNSGRSSAAGEAQSSEAPTVSEGRKTIRKIDIEDPIFIGLEDGTAIQGENVDLNEQQDNLVFGGITTIQKFNEKPVEIESVKVFPSKNIDLIQADQRLNTFSKLPGNFNLSDNFTVQSLSTRTAITPSKIKAYPEIDLTVGNIAFNLQLLSLNVLEVAFGLFPNLVILSGYRHKENTNSTSQHFLGKAVDISFRGASKKQVFENAKDLVNLINFDQYILNYTNYSNIAWIHISIEDGVRNLNRNSIETYWNNRKFSNGLLYLT